MPPIILAITGVLIAIGVPEAAAAFLAPFILSIGAGLVLGQVSKLLTKSSSNTSLTNNVASRSITARQAGEPFED